MSTATLRPIRRLCPSTARTSVRARPGPAAARLRSSRPEPARVPAGYVAKILVDEGEEVPTSTVREPQQPDPLCLKARVMFSRSWSWSRKRRTSALSAYVARLPAPCPHCHSDPIACCRRILFLRRWCGKLLVTRTASAPLTLVCDAGATGGCCSHPRACCSASASAAPRSCCCPGGAGSALRSVCPSRRLQHDHNVLSLLACRRQDLCQPVGEEAGGRERYRLGGAERDRPPQPHHRCGR